MGNAVPNWRKQDGISGNSGILMKCVVLDMEHSVKKTWKVRAARSPVALSFCALS